ncbi:MAG: PQQ-dependent sugar dehydrogenase [Opitutaceae bacterium]
MTQRPLPQAPLRTGLLLALLACLAPASARADDPLGDPSHGRVLFQQYCALCHAAGLEKQASAGQGPILAGVVGRPAASIPFFGYTKALAASRLTWDRGTLDRFLSNPPALVPGTAMVVVVADRSDRNDLISYLATLPAVDPAAFAVAAASGQKSAGDWQSDAPGTVHSVRIDLLPAPFATGSAGNGPSTVDKPAGAALSVPSGFSVRLFASGLSGPRLLRTAPNGDVFIAETRSGRIRVLRTVDGAEAPSENRIFAEGLQGPFGIAFYPLGGDPKWVYVGNLNSVVRFPYQSGDLVARGPAEIVVPVLTTGGTGGHTTRDVVFSLDGRRMFISVGSGSNVAEGGKTKTPEEIRVWEAVHGFGAAWGPETNRANILQTDPEGHDPLRTYATGIRNAVGLAVEPATGNVWCSTNERDGLGDDLVPDYITHVREGGFYGWPWYYMGNHEDPRHAGERPELSGKTIDPDVPLQAHSASLEMTFYTATSGPAVFPEEYRGNIFAAEHGSWNRATRTGSKVIRVLFRDGAPTGQYQDFLTGFVVDNHHVWGRPVGVTVAHDGALLVTEDANDTVWRIAYAGSAGAK